MKQAIQESICATRDALSNRGFECLVVQMARMGAIEPCDVELQPLCAQCVLLVIEHGVRLTRARCAAVFVRRFAGPALASIPFLLAYIHSSVGLAQTVCIRSIFVLFCATISHL